MKNTLAALILCLTSSAAFAVSIVVPNFSFEDSTGTFVAPTGWKEDQARVLSGAGFAHTGHETNTGGLLPALGAQYGRVSIIGDADPLTSFYGSMSTQPTLIGTFEADKVYTLSFQVARNDFFSTNQRFLRSGLRAGGVDVATATGDLRTIATTEDQWATVTLNFDTSQNVSAVGQDITIFLGWEHNDNFNKAIYFDNVTLTAVPEPATYAISLSIIIAAITLWRRHKSKQ